MSCIDLLFSILNFRRESSISSLTPVLSVTPSDPEVMTPESSTVAIPVTITSEASTAVPVTIMPPETSATFQKITERFLAGLNYEQSDTVIISKLLMKLGGTLEIFNKPDIKYRILEAINSDTAPTLQENDSYHFEIFEDMLPKEGQSSQKRIRIQIELLKKIFNALTSADIPDLKFKFLEAIHKFAREMANYNTGSLKITPVVIEDD